MNKIIYRIFILGIMSSALKAKGQTFYDSIPVAQRHALNISPYRDAGYAFTYIQPQLAFRKQNFPGLIKKLLSGALQLRDTLWIVERFDDECSDCACSISKILYRDTLYCVQPASHGSNKFVVHSYNFDLNKNDPEFASSHYELFEVKRRNSIRKPWTEETLKYGQDGCNDGSHTFLTMITPQGNTTAIYVRCWYKWVGKDVD